MTSRDDPPSAHALAHLVPPDVRARIPVMRIDEHEADEPPADTAYAAIGSPSGVHLIALAYDYEDMPHLYFALTVTSEQPEGVWGDIDLWHLHTEGVVLSADTAWEPRPMDEARRWARECVR
jgi:hypothetical protein